MEAMETANVVDAHELYKNRILSSKPESGWYQNNDGELFHYNGSYWDVFPQSVVDNLEHLG